MIIIESVFSSSVFAEIEAKEARDWLRAAGFPQYVQLFKGKQAEDEEQGIQTTAAQGFTRPVSVSDCRFPVDVEEAKRDHHFLDKDALDSLCR